MKKIILSLFLATYMMANVDTDSSAEDKSYLIKEYQDMFQKISQKRVGLDEGEIIKVKPPFVKVVKKNGTKSAEKIKKEKPLVLEAILGKQVLINGHWYKLYSHIGDYKIVSIINDSVYLKGNGTKLKLTIRKKNANIIIK
jgi:hypothetical protein